jgi:hypothetical protein
VPRVEATTALESKGEAADKENDAGTPELNAKLAMLEPSKLEICED